MSFVEVYMERIVDLLNPSHSLHLHENSFQGVYIQPKRVAIPSYQSFVRHLTSASANRHLSSYPTPYSSRSHTVLYIYLSNGQRESILRIVDLAGMQMIRSTASSKDGTEIRKTNIGLVALLPMTVLTSSLARVIRSLVTENASSAYMGFRDSKLTRLLQPCFDRCCFTQFLLCLRNSSCVKVTIKS